MIGYTPMGWNAAVRLFVLDFKAADESIQLTG